MFGQQRVYLLTQTRSHADLVEGSHWRFLLKSLDGDFDLDASDFEPGVFGEHLELLTVVRGLEALEQSSSVTLVTDSRYVIRGLRYGLTEWRDNGWKWQRFGEQTEINHASLWRRVDNALQYHRLQCRFFRIDGGHAGRNRVRGPHFGMRRKSAPTTPAAYVDPMTGLSQSWMGAAEKLARTLDDRWERTLEAV